MKFVVEIGGERREVVGFVEYALANWEDYIASGRRKCESFTVTVHADVEDCDHELPEPLSVVGSAQRKGTG